MRWKEDADKQVHNQLLVETEEMINENQNLTNDLEFKQEKRTKQVDRANHQQVSKLERVRNMFLRKSMRRYYDKWVAGARVINGLDHGLAKMNKVEHSFRLRANFYKWRSQAKAATRKELIDRKCAWFEQ